MIIYFHTLNFFSGKTYFYIQVSFSYIFNIIRIISITECSLLHFLNIFYIVKCTNFAKFKDNFVCVLLHYTTEHISSLPHLMCWSTNPSTLRQNNYLLHRLGYICNSKPLDITMSECFFPMNNFYLRKEWSLRNHKLKFSSRIQ